MPAAITSEICEFKLYCSLNILIENNVFHINEYISSGNL